MSDAVKIMKQMWKDAEKKSATSYGMMGSVVIIAILYGLLLLVKFNENMPITSTDLLGGCMTIPLLFMIFKNAVDSRRNREEIHNLYLEMVMKNETKIKNKTKKRRIL